MIVTKLFTVAEALEVVPLSRSGMFQAIKREEIPVIRVGKRVFIPSWWIAKITQQPAEKQGA